MANAIGAQPMVGRPQAFRGNRVSGGTNRWLEVRDAATVEAARLTKPVNKNAPNGEDRTQQRPVADGYRRNGTNGIGKDGLARGLGGDAGTAAPGIGRSDVRRLDRIAVAGLVRQK